MLCACIMQGTTGFQVDITSDINDCPDTLTNVSLLDTLSASVWLTGSDTLNALGLSIVFDPGELTIIADPAGTNYRTPSAWTNVSMLIEDDRILLQSTDFSLQAPLVLPAEIAVIKLLGSGLDSCVSVGLDFSGSGTMTTQFVTSAPTSSCGVEICFTGVQQSATSGGGEGGSTESTISNSPQNPSSFEEAFEVNEDSYLYVQGKRLRGSIEWKWEESTGLSANEERVLPTRDKHDIYAGFEDQLISLHNNTPMVQHLWEEGSDTLEAIAAWDRAVGGLVGKIHTVYYSSYHQDQDSVAARKAVELETLSSYDTLLCVGGVSWEQDLFQLELRGDVAPVRKIERKLMSRPTAVRGRLPSYNKARELVLLVKSVLTTETAAIFCVPEGGDFFIIKNGERDTDGLVQEAMQQLTSSSLATLAPGPFRETALREILVHGGIEQ